MLEIVRREVEIHQSLTRPLLLAGGERELVLMNAIIIAALILGVGFHWLSFSLALLLATLGQYLLTKLAKHDPQLRLVYIRHIKYQAFYPANSKCTAPCPRVTPTSSRYE